MNKLIEHREEFLKTAQESDQSAKFPKQTIQTLINMGYTQLVLPMKYGGEGINISDMVVLQETLARFDGAAALSIGWHLSVVGELYEKNLWTKDQLESLASDILNGGLINRAASELKTGSPTRGGRPTTYAVKKGDKWVINGRKAFTTMLPMLTHLLVTAWVEQDQGIGTFLIKRNTKGVSMVENWDVISMRGTESHDLLLENVEVPLDHYVEPPNRRKKGINGWLLHIPAVYLGIAQAARDYVLEFATIYAPNSIDGTISDLPNVRRLIGEIEMELFKARTILYHVSNALDDENRKPFTTNEIGIAKSIVTNTAIDIVDKAMRIVGARSLQLANPLQRYYRDVRAGLHNPPMDDMTYVNLAQAAINKHLTQKT